MTASIIAVDAIEALDSRGRPTVSTRVRLAGGAEAIATVPSGASTGSFEALELRDGGARYAGWGVRRAVASVIDVLGPAVVGIDASDQAAIDATLRDTDGTAGLGRLGANAVLSVSVAAMLAAAADAGQPPYVMLARLAGVPPTVPMPMVNILSGGAHAGRYVDVQDFLAVPLGARDVAEAIETVAAVRSATAEVARAAGHDVALVADEGGLALRLESNRAVLEVLSAGIEASGAGDVGIAIDVAAHQFAVAGGYRLAAEDRVVETEAWLEELVEWVDSYPIVSIEDPVDEDDWHGWELATTRLGEKVQILGDDFFVTNPARVRRGIDTGVANAVLVKPNQIGTLTDAAEVVRMARAGGYATVVSARSGETEDSWLADLATGWAAGQIKVGSTMRSERTAKWNRLMWIERDLGTAGTFAGRGALYGQHS